MAREPKYIKKADGTFAGSIRVGAEAPSAVELPPVGIPDPNAPAEPSNTVNTVGPVNPVSPVSIEEAFTRFYAHRAAVASATGELPGTARDAWVPTACVVCGNPQAAASAGCAHQAATVVCGEHLYTADCEICGAGVDPTSIYGL